MRDLRRQSVVSLLGPVVCSSVAAGDGVVESVRHRRRFYVFCTRKHETLVEKKGEKLVKPTKVRSRGGGYACVRAVVLCLLYVNDILVYLIAAGL